MTKKFGIISVWMALVIWAVSCSRMATPQEKEGALLTAISAYFSSSFYSPDTPFVLRDEFQGELASFLNKNGASWLTPKDSMTYSGPKYLIASNWIIRNERLRVSIREKIGSNYSQQKYSIRKEDSGWTLEGEPEWLYEIGCNFQDE